MLRIWWTQRKANTKILREMGKECEVIKNYENTEITIPRIHNVSTALRVAQINHVGKLKQKRIVG